MPAQAFLLSHKYPLLSFAEKNAGKMKFTPQPRARRPSFATCAHADETLGADDHKINIEAAAVSSFLPGCAVVSWAGPQGSPGSGGRGAARAALRLRAAPSWREPPQPEPCSSPTVVQESGDAVEGPQIWFPHVKVKKGRSLVSQPQTSWYRAGIGVQQSTAEFPSPR